MKCNISKLSKDSGVSRAYIYKIKTCKANNVGIETLGKLASALKCTNLEVINKLRSEV